MRQLIYFNNNVNYIQQLAQEGQKSDLKVNTERIRREYSTDFICFFSPCVVLLLSILLYYSYYAAVFVFLTIVIGYVVICFKVIALVESCQLNFLNLCKAVISFENQSKNCIQIGKYDSAYQEAHDHILEELTRTIERSIIDKEAFLLERRKMPNEWESYLQLKPFLFKALFKEFNEAFCSSKLYLMIYFNSRYSNMLFSLLRAFNRAIGIIQFNHFSPEDERSIYAFLNKIENSLQSQDHLQRISTSIERDLKQIDKLALLISSIQANCLKDIKNSLDDIISAKEASLASLKAIRKELFPMIELKKDEEERSGRLEEEEKQIESKGKSYSLFELILNQHKTGEAAIEENKEAIKKGSEERINLFELMKGEREVRGLKTSLIDELAEYHKKHKGNAVQSDEHF